MRCRFARNHPSSTAHPMQMAYGCEGGPVEKQRPLGHTPRGLAVAPRHNTDDQEHAVMLNDFSTSPHIGVTM